MVQFFIPVFLVCFLWSGPAAAEPDQFTPYVFVQQEYSDNILFASSDEKEDFITTARAGLLYNHRAERINAQLDGSLEQLIYQDNSELNDTQGRALARLDVQVTERMGLGGSVMFRRDSRRDEDRTDTGILVSGDREEAGFQTSADYLFTEKTRGELSLEYTRTQLDDPDETEDNDMFRVDFALTRNLSQIFRNTTGLVNFSYFQYTSDQEDILNSTTTSVQDSTSDVFQFSAGFSRQITELFSYYVQAGASYTKTEEGTRIRQVIFGFPFDSVRTEFSDSSLGGVLATGLNYKGLYTDMGLSLSHDVRGGTGTNGTVERSALSLGVSRKVTEDFSLTLDSSIYLNISERENRADLDELTFHFQPGFRYRFKEDWILTGGLRFTSEDDREQNITTERNLIYFAIRKNFEL